MIFRHPAQETMMAVGGHLLRVPGLGLGFVLVEAGSVWGQGVVMRGRVTDEVTDQPVATAAVYLVETSGRRVVATITDSQGRYRLTAPIGGKYRVRADRVGYVGRETGEITVSAERETVVDLFLSPHPIRFDSILVTGKVEAGQRLGVTEQLIHGRLVDDETRRAIAGGAIELMSGGKVLATTLANENGLFRLISPRPGKYVLRATHLGYKTADSPELQMSLGDTIRLDFHLSTHAVLLAPIVVTASARDWLKRAPMIAMEPMLRRMAKYARSGYGDFMTRDTLAVYQKNGYSTTVMLRMRALRKAAALNDGSCTPVFFLNDAPFPMPDLSWDKLDDMFPLHMLEAVEVYVAPDIPGDLMVDAFRKPGTYGAPCRVIAMWSRR